MAAAPEVIYIGFDNSAWMRRYSVNLDAQLEAIEYYCRTKFETNPGSVVGIFTMSESCYDEYLDPSSDLEEIVDKAQDISTGRGYLDVKSALLYNAPFVKEWCPGLKKRILLFTGGPTNLNPTFVAEYSKILKDWSIAIDVVNFYPEDSLCVYSKHGYHFGKRELRDLFAATNGDDGNSHFVQVEPESTPIEDSMSIFKKDHSEEYSERECHKTLQPSCKAAANDQPLAVAHHRFIWFGFFGFFIFIFQNLNQI